MKVYIGIDWSENKHDICLMHESGEVLRVLHIKHTIAGFRELDQARQSLGVELQEALIGLETAHTRLRSILLRYYPAAAEAFSHLDGLVGLAFLQAYPTSQQAACLSFEDLQAFLREHHHTQPRSWPKIYARLHDDQPRPNPAVQTAYWPLAVAQARILEQLVRSRNECLARLGKLYWQHPDHEIYDSLPRAGALLGPALLAKLGDDRGRYPTPAVLQAVAGTCPITSRSGKYARVYFRTACDHDFRYIVQQWARLTLEASPWAVALYSSVRPHCKNENDAIRRLANRWLEILWRLWVDKQPYNEALHLKQPALRSKPC